MIRVLFMIPSLAHGGAERVLVNLVNNMDPSKFAITIRTIFDIGVNKQYLSNNIEYKSSFKKVFRGNSKIIACVSPRLLYKFFVRDEHYDVIISYLEGPTARILSGCPYPDTKKVCWIHIEFLKSMKSKWRKTYQSYDNIICVSETVLQRFQESAKVNFDHIEVLYNTNETEIIRSKAKERVEDIKFDKDTINICSVAKIVPSKGYDRLIRVHERLLRDGLHNHVYVIGIGEQQQELEKYIEKRGLSETFTFVGFRENPYKYMAKCDVYVCSSRKEGFSTAVTEALILGKPVVSTCCSGAYEQLGRNNEYGIVVENSEDGIYNGLKTILTSKDLLSRYCERATVRGSLFSKEKTVAAVEKMLLKISQ